MFTSTRRLEHTFYVNHSVVTQILKLGIFILIYLRAGVGVSTKDFKGILGGFFRIH